MPKQYRGGDARQTLLLPPSLHEWLPEGHLAYFVLEAVDQLDIRAIEDVIQAKDPRGTRPYSPRMMVALLIYAYANGVFSSRRIARACVENVAFRVVSGDCQPYFTNIAEFRRVHLKALGALFLEVLRLCRAAGLVKGEHLHLDGTKVQANASKHKAMSYERMLKAEEELAKEIDELLKQAEEADAAEDAEHGEGKDGDDDAAPEVRRRESRRDWIRRTREALEEEAKKARAAELREKGAAQRAAAENEPDPKEESRRLARAAASEARADELDPPPAQEEAPAKEPDPEELPTHRPAHDKNGTPAPKAQRNFTDADSRIMQTKKGAYDQCYNGQVVADEASHVIVAHGLSNQAPDCEYLPGMLARSINALGSAPATLTADNGYFSQDNIRACLHADVQPYLAAGRERRSWPPPTPTEGAPPRGATAKEWMAWMLRTQEGQNQMRKRKSTVELVFGCIKEAMGFRRFLLRGLEKVRDEWALVCLAYNMRKLHTAGRR